MSQKVLLIEDDTTMLSLLRTLLGMEGFDVAALEFDTDLDSILAFIRAEQPEAVLMDVNLRQVNGIELLKAIRKDELVHSTRVIMTSGMDVGDRCLEQGADAFILKPYMPDELIQQIRRVLPEQN